ncbi:MAG: class I SAM-dependent DNA methyltransferase [Aequorivita sp.]
MDKYQETFNTWNKVAKIYEDKFMNFDLYNDTYDIFLNSIPNKYSSVLDIGCGPGNITKYFLSKNIDLKIKGIDISENMVEIARNNNPSAVFEIMDIREVHCIKDKFDAIVCGFCIPYISQSDCSKLIADCKNRLNDSGMLYLSLVTGNYEDSGFISGNGGERMYFYYHNLDYLENELKVNSFEMRKVLLKKHKKPDGSEETHTVLILRKLT